MSRVHLWLVLLETIHGEYGTYSPGTESIEVSPSPEINIAIDWKNHYVITWMLKHATLVDVIFGKWC